METSSPAVTVLELNGFYCAGLGSHGIGGLAPVLPSGNLTSILDGMALAGILPGWIEKLRPLAPAARLGVYVGWDPFSQGGLIPKVVGLGLSAAYGGGQ